MFTEYPPNWKEIVVQIRARDQKRCILCGSNKRLDVHHTREKAIPENLITLCHNCHRRWGNSYVGFKKKIRVYNNIRLNKNKSQEEKIQAHNELIREINERVQRIKNLRTKIKKQNHKTLDKF